MLCYIQLLASLGKIFQPTNHKKFAGTLDAVLGLSGTPSTALAPVLRASCHQSFFCIGILEKFFLTRPIFVL
jgi:hypothetical protein